MFNINRSNIDTISKTPNSKLSVGKAHKVLFDTFKLSVINLIESIIDYSVYDMAHWITNIDRWICNQSSDNTTKYGRGALVHLDLGAQNFRYEPSYAHICVVLVDRKNTILVVPSSSKKYGKGFPEIIDADSTNGFSCNTGVQVESFRWVHKNRVISQVGKADNDLLNEIDRRMLSMIPTYKLEITQYQSTISNLEQKIKDLEENMNKGSS